jgi:GTPase SAR1 family protein
MSDAFDTDGLSNAFSSSLSIDSSYTPLPIITPQAPSLSASSSTVPSSSTGPIRSSVHMAEEIIKDQSPTYPSVISGLKKLYATKIRPVEEKYKFDMFHSPLLRDSDFDAKPMVLLLGQYSTGKTTFIEYLLNQPYPGERIGPEPTTDRFVAVMGGTEDRIIPGNALSMDADKPFNALNRFGNGFLSKFEAAESTSPLLQKLTLIDTPGVLSGEKQRIGRTYDFVSVCEWFAERADMILLLFDCAKLDISDEFKRVIMTLRGHDDKIRVILNKSDGVSSQQLMRVYGALMWSLGKVVPTPEVMRVYIGSFWNQPYHNQENIKLFEAEQADLIKDLHGLPKNAAVRKINELVKRARLARVHAHIMGHLKGKMPSFFGKESKKQELMDNLDKEFREIERMYKLPPGDFPDPNKFRVHLGDIDLDKVSKINSEMFERINEVLSVEIPKLMSLISPSKADREAQANPFAESSAASGWIIDSPEKTSYDTKFYALAPQNGKLSGQQVKQTLLETGVPPDVLRKVWTLSDIDKDGLLDSDEFAVAMYLCNAVRQGKMLPDKDLPAALVPPNKRRYL